VVGLASGGGDSDVRTSDESDASSSISMKHKPSPTLATYPSGTRISFRVPSYGLVTSTLALSLCTSQSRSDMLVVDRVDTFLSKQSRLKEEKVLYGYGI
jgi:hypothetical protein